MLHTRHMLRLTDAVISDLISLLPQSAGAVAEAADAVDAMLAVSDPPNSLRDASEIEASPRQLPWTGRQALSNDHPIDFEAHVATYQRRNSSTSCLSTTDHMREVQTTDERLQPAPQGGAKRRELLQGCTSDFDASNVNALLNALQNGGSVDSGDTTFGPITDAATTVVEQCLLNTASPDDIKIAAIISANAAIEASLLDVTSTTTTMSDSLLETEALLDATDQAHTTTISSWPTLASAVHDSLTSRADVLLKLLQATVDVQLSNNDRDFLAVSAALQALLGTMEGLATAYSLNTAAILAAYLGSTYGAALDDYRQCITNREPAANFTFTIPSNAATGRRRILETWQGYNLSFAVEGDYLLTPGMRSRPKVVGAKGNTVFGGLMLHQVTVSVSIY